MLFALNFDMSFPTSNRFLERFSRLLQEDASLNTNAQYIIELAMLDLKIISYPPSIVAGAALYVAMKVR